MIKSTSLDKLAILLSGVCMLHCLITPVVLTLLPIISLNAFFEDLLFHQLMLWLVLPTSAIALFLGCRKHRLWHIAATGIAGMAILISVALFGHDIFGLFGEKVATSIGGIVLAMSHYFNFRACQSITCDDQDCASKHHH